MDSKEEKILFEKITGSDEKAFEKLFHRYYAHLCLFATKIIRDDASAEEIVQAFFVKLWEKRARIQVDSSVRNYFFRSVKNLCINHIKHEKIKNKHAENVVFDADNTFFENNYREVDLAEKIEECIDSLPEKRREIFLLSREKGLKYREIAEKLNISIKTVETQMGLAIKTLREKLKNFYTFFLLF